MNVEKYSRSITMMCSTCGNKDFEFDQDEGPIRCTNCSHIFTRGELIRDNDKVIEGRVDELKNEVLSDVAKELSEMLRKTFRNSKHLKHR